MPLDLSKGQPANTKKKRPKVLIVRAGVAGMATEAYLQMNGFDTHIVERHVIPGGCCTAWLLGSAPSDDADQVSQINNDIDLPLKPKKGASNVSAA
ncbi:NAD(P)-binding protein [Aliikangiella sp. IMCC44359]|uniref:NAD(P)-binding protein n=1 Tax=Aliikangiella sp. IMCC44359 TaxID=3459125 RepID=UPI00403B1378